MIKFFQNLETTVKLIMFFLTVIGALFVFVIKSYISITESLILIQKNQIEIKEISIYKDITISAFVDKQYEKVLINDLADIKEADMQLLAIYSENLKLDIGLKYKIDKILTESEVK